MKRVAIQQELSDIRNALEKRGYETCSFYEKGYVDAIVYIDDYDGLKNLNNQSEIDNEGAILINAKNRTIEEIEYIIEKRRYGSLF